MAYFKCRGVPAPTPTPTPSDYLYNWDLTQSLIDSVQGATLTVGEHAQRTSAGLTDTWGTGEDILTLPNNVDLLSTSHTYELEIDFAAAFWTYQEGPTILTYHNEISEWFGMIFSSDDGTISVNTEHGYYSLAGTNESYFSGSTFKIVTSLSANNNVQWSIYRDGTLLDTTPELSGDNITPFFTIDDSSTYTTWGVPNDTGDDIIITGLRIKQTS